jgi:SAM-dependent methyltransferase
MSKRDASVSANQDQALDLVEAETRAKYGGAFYRADTIMRGGQGETRDYFGRLDQLKRGWLAEFASGRPTLDLCCATALHLLDLSPRIPFGAGLDFSRPFLEKAREESKLRKLRNTAFAIGNARRLPFRDGVFGCVYCLSSLYHIPRAGEVVAEIGRVLAEDGFAILDLGNRRSLNEWVGRAHTETARPCSASVGEMRRWIKEAGLSVARRRVFQILPYWGNKPRWLRPLLSPFWGRLMSARIGGAMIDEWLCRLPVLSSFAFRHVYICVKRKDRQ